MVGTDGAGLPPSYLGIEGHKQCLSSHVAAAEDTHESVCLPMVQPKDCLPEAYMKLAVVVANGEIQPCGVSLTGAAGTGIKGPGGMPWWTWWKWNGPLTR